MNVEPTSFAGVYVLKPIIHKDNRGLFVKHFQKYEFEKHGLKADFKEHYTTVSNYHVFRGLHFQVPPADGYKMVHCSVGGCIDILLDLRKSSVTYGKTISVKLSDTLQNAIYMPAGIAHGFIVNRWAAQMHYFLEKEYAPEYDSGVRYAGINEWVASERDKSFPTLAEFESPFE